MSGRFVSNELVHTVSFTWLPFHTMHDGVKETHNTNAIFGIFQVTVDHPQATTVEVSTAAPAATLAEHSSANHGQLRPIETAEPSKTSPQPQQVVLHQVKPAGPSHVKMDRHHVDIHPGQSISDVYIGSGIGGTVQAAGHLSSGASKSFILSTTLFYRLFVRAVHQSVWLVWLNRFSWANGESAFTVPRSTVGSNPVKIVETDSNRFVAGP